MRHFHGQFYYLGSYRVGVRVGGARGGEQGGGGECTTATIQMTVLYYIGRRWLTTRAKHAPHMKNTCRREARPALLSFYLSSIATILSYYRAAVVVYMYIIL